VWGERGKCGKGLEFPFFCRIFFYMIRAGKEVAYVRRDWKDRGTFGALRFPARGKGKRSRNREKNTERSAYHWRSWSRKG
jgi:hypothetical protein